MNVDEQPLGDSFHPPSTETTTCYHDCLSQTSLPSLLDLNTALRAFILVSVAAAYATAIPVHEYPIEAFPSRHSYRKRIVRRLFGTLTIR